MIMLSFINKRIRSTTNREVSGLMPFVFKVKRGVWWAGAEHMSGLEQPHLWQVMGAYLMLSSVVNQFLLAFEAGRSHWGHREH